MKVSVNWVKEFTDIKLSTEELVSAIGAQLGEVEEVLNLGERYEGIVVAKVLDVQDHPNADRLHVCNIDDGGVTKGISRDGNGNVQVVCGAPNVKKGMLVAWIPPHCVVPSSWDTERFTLEAREIRGVMSNGMLASGKELAINDDHDGILEISDKVSAGTALSEVYDLDDTIIEIENKMFTHRPDLFGILGIARELAGIQNIAFKSPEWYKNARAVVSQGEELDLRVSNELTSLVPRFLMVPIAGVSVGPSPIKMQSYLSRVGINPINNIVDVTNFISMLTAQPLHAFDYDKILELDGSREAKIVLRHPKKGEKIALLNGKSIEPREEAIMVATPKHLLAVGGVMGGSATEVDKHTTNVLLECATFDMYSIRRTSMAHGLFTDAVTRYNKGQSPLQNDRIFSYALSLIKDTAGGRVAGKVHDLKEDTFRQHDVTVSPQFVNERLGLKLTGNEIKKHLENVEFEITDKRNELQVMPPFWRTDIEVPEDVVEEIGRLIGYDHLPLKLPLRSVAPVQTNPLLDLKSDIRDILSRSGANELLTYSFVHGNLLERAGQDKQLAYGLSNALSPELQYYRMSLLPSLLDKVHPNIKAGHESFAIFEINKAHDKSNVHEDGLPVEEERLALVVAADDKTAPKGSAYFWAKYYANELLHRLGFDNLVYELTKTHTPKYDTDKQALAPFEPNRSAYIKTANGILLGIVGEVRASTRKGFKLPAFTAGFELDVLMLQQYRGARPYRPLSRFPSTHQDISFQISQTVSYAELHQVVGESLERARSEHGYVISLSPLDIYHPEHKNNLHMSFRIQVTHNERTLTTTEINSLLDTVAEHAHTKLKAVRL